MSDSQPRSHRRKVAACLAGALLLSGGGAGAATDAPTTAQRARAAARTAESNADCTAIEPFYWEIGDAAAARAAGSVGRRAPAASTVMPIASASKWLFGAYLVQLRDGHPSDADVAALTMQSGYTNLSYASCLRLLPAAQDAESVGQCFEQSHRDGSGSNSDFNPGDVGRFFYNGGHFQKYAAVDLGLGGDDDAALAAAIAAQLGTEIPLTYHSPQLAAGLRASASGYAIFLRKILADRLLMHDALGTHAVCTNPSTCATAAYTPIPSSESWHYSLAHWVEDDPAFGDGAFSSPGAFGFYPWIDASKTTYGVLARHALGAQASIGSVLCGRDIRKAWLTGEADLASSAH